MRFMVDECTGPAVALWLKGQGHEVFSVFHQARGMSDESIIRKAYSENYILITNDKDFGEKIYRAMFPHRGVIVLRLADERPSSKIDVLDRLLGVYHDQLADRFVVVTESRVRFARRRMLR